MMANAICKMDPKNTDIILIPVVKSARSISILLCKTEDGVYVEMRILPSLNIKKYPIANVVVPTAEDVAGEIQFSIHAATKVSFR